MIDLSVFWSFFCSLVILPEKTSKNPDGMYFLCGRNTNLWENANEPPLQVFGENVNYRHYPIQGNSTASPMNTQYMIVALLPEFEENKTTEHRFFCQGSPVYIKWKQGFAFLESVFPLILLLFFIGPAKTSITRTMCSFTFGYQLLDL